MNPRTFPAFLRALAVFGLFATVGVATLRAAPATGRTINIDFGPVGSPVFNGVGADPDDTGVVWNVLSPSATTSTISSGSLLDSKGNVTAAKIVTNLVTAVSTTGGSNPTGNVLLQDYLAGQEQTLTLTFTGLTPFGVYRVYLYGAGSESGQGSLFVSGSIQAATTGTARGDTFIQGVNYAVVSLICDDLGKVSFYLAGNLFPAASTPILNGLQIQQTTDAATTAPRFDDAFDVSQGTVIIGGSATLSNEPLTQGIGGRADGFAEPGNILFADDPAGTVEFFEFQMPTTRTIKSISLFANHDIVDGNGNPGNINERGATRITLWAYNPATAAYDIKAFEIYPSDPYALTLAPPGAAVENNGDPSRLIVTANIKPVTTDRFRLELVTAGDHSGVRFGELDGFTTLNPSLTEPVPIITTATSTTGRVDTPLSYQLAASNDPTTYFAEGLPDGMTLDPATGLITGTPTAEGTFDAAVSASNTTGLGPVATLRFVISEAGDNIQKVAFLSPPADITVIENDTLTLYAAVDFTPGKLAEVQIIAINDATGAEDVLVSGDGVPPGTTWQPTVPGDYTLKAVVTDINEEQKEIGQTIHVLAASAGTAPVVEVFSGVADQQFALGGTVEVVATATDQDGNPLTDVQFFLDGQPISTTAGGIAAAAKPGKQPLRGVHKDSGDGDGERYARCRVPLARKDQIVTVAARDLRGVSAVSRAVKLHARAAAASVHCEIDSPADSSSVPAGVASRTVASVTASSDRGQIAAVEFFVDGVSAQQVGAPPYAFPLPALAEGTHVLSAVATDDAGLSNASDSVLVAAVPLPTVTITATTPADANTGQAGVFTLERDGDLSADVIVQYTIKGKAVNGVNYKTLKGFKKIKAGKGSARVRIVPLGTGGGEGVKKSVKLVLDASEDYTVGSAGAAKLKIIGAQ